MRSKLEFKCQAFMCAVAFLLMITPFILVSSAHAVTIIRLQCVYPKSSTPDHMEFFADKVKEYTNGKVQIKLYWPGQLAKTAQLFNAIQQGQVEAGWLGGLYYSGIAPEGNGEALPYCWRNSFEMADIWTNFGYADVMREALKKHGVRYLAPISVQSITIISKKPITKLEDLKGMKIRSAGMTGEIVKALGGVPVFLPPVEIYTGLQRGVIDGVYYPRYTFESYKFDEVAKNVLSPALTSPIVTSLLINDDVYNKLLNDEQKKAVDRAAIETMWRSCLTGNLGEIRSQQYVEMHGVKENVLSKEEVAKFMKAAMAVWDEHAKRSPLCAKQIQILKDYAKKRPTLTYLKLTEPLK